MSPKIKYIQDDEHNCCFSSLTSTLFEARSYVAEMAVMLQLKSSLLCESNEYKDRIKFENYIMMVHR